MIHPVSLKEVVRCHGHLFRTDTGDENIHLPRSGAEIGEKEPFHSADIMIGFNQTGRIRVEA